MHPDCFRKDQQLVVNCRHAKYEVETAQPRHLVHDLNHRRGDRVGAIASARIPCRMHNQSFHHSTVPCTVCWVYSLEKSAKGASTVSQWTRKQRNHCGGARVSEWNQQKSLNSKSCRGMSSTTASAKFCRMPWKRRFGRSLRGLHASLDQGDMLLRGAPMEMFVMGRCGHRC